MSIFSSKNMDKDRALLIKDNVIKKLKSYFIDRLNSTYKYRDILNIGSITLDEYFAKIKDKSLTEEDHIKVRLNKEEINTLVSYIDKYFEVAYIDIVEEVNDSEFLYKLLNMVKLTMEPDSEELKELYKYIICLDSLKEYLIEQDFMGKFYYKGNKYISVKDNNNNIFIKYCDELDSNFVMSYSPIYFLDKLYVLSNDKYNKCCVYDFDIYYSSIPESCMISKRFEAQSLESYLENNNADFLIQTYYRNSEEINNIFKMLASFKLHCKVNRVYAEQCAGMLFNEVVKKQMFENHQKEIFVSIVSDEILQQLFMNNSALLHNEYPGSDCLDEALCEANIHVDGALALFVSPDNIDISRGYEAFKKIYYGK